MRYGSCAVRVAYHARPFGEAMRKHGLRS